MLLRRFKEHVRSENWFAVVLDLAVVVVGLFIGLQIDNWWGAQKDAQLESAYLLEIQEDFEANKSDLESTILEIEQVIRDMIVLHAQSTLAEPSLSSAELNKHFSSINRMPTFLLVSRALRQSNGFR